MRPFLPFLAKTLIGALLLLTFSAAACTTESGMQLTFGEKGDTVEVLLTQSFTFSPSQVTIPAGTVVRWVNTAPIFHTITPDGHTEWVRATLSEEGQTFEHTFEVPGTFPYYCEVHLDQDMTGTIVVE
jgi:plastocyanin